MQDLLANDETTPTFVEGRSTRRTWTPTIYHRSHASVGGKIVKAYVQPGTYYSEADSEADDFAAPNRSQAYLAHVATPALIFIEADDPVIGLMCVISVGMAEVSSCVIGSKIRPGYRVRKGDESSASRPFLPSPPSRARRWSRCGARSRSRTEL